MRKWLRNRWLTVQRMWYGGANGRCRRCGDKLEYYEQRFFASVCFECLGAWFRAMQERDRQRVNAAREPKRLRA